MIVTVVYQLLGDGTITDEEVELEVEAIPREGETVWLNGDDLRVVRYVVHHLDPDEGHRVIVALTIPQHAPDPEPDEDVRESLDKLLQGGVVFFDRHGEFGEAQRLVDAAAPYGAEARYEGDQIAVYLRSRRSDPREESTG